jgi:hypothetical protein
VVISHQEPPSKPDIKVCVDNTTVVTDKVIEGFDYLQTMLNTTGPAAITACIQECCAASACKAWAITESSSSGGASTKCWLKSGGTMDQRPGQLACGLKTLPPPSPASVVPPSGWVALVSTLGVMQFDNFGIDGTAEGNGAVRSCGQTSPTSGNALVSAPCDHPGASTSFTTDVKGGQVVLVTAGAREGSSLCIGGGIGTNVTLVECGSAAALMYDVSTGRLTPRSNQQHCLTAIQRQQNDAALPKIAVAPCVAIPDESQQFQFNPTTGALRQKGSHCIAQVADTALAYRDCCIALCL